MATQGHSRDVVILSGKRTGFGTFGGSLKDFTATDLGAGSLTISAQDMVEALRVTSSGAATVTAGADLTLATLTAESLAGTSGGAAALSSVTTSGAASLAASAPSSSMV